MPVGESANAAPDPVSRGASWQRRVAEASCRQFDGTEILLSCSARNGGNWTCFGLLMDL
jgi:hypothetical protein